MIGDTVLDDAQLKEVAAGCNLLTQTLAAWSTGSIEVALQDDSVQTLSAPLWLFSCRNCSA